MTDQIDSPLLMGIAAIISSIAGLATALRAWKTPKAARPRRHAAADEKRREEEGLRA